MLSTPMTSPQQPGVECLITWPYTGRHCGR